MWLKKALSGAKHGQWCPHAEVAPYVVSQGPRGLKNGGSQPGGVSRWTNRWTPSACHGLEALA